MNSKLLIQLLLLLGASQAFADFHPTGKPLSIYCLGSQGELTLDADAEKKELKMAIVIDKKTTLIEIDSITAYQKKSKPSVSSTYFEYDDTTKNFISIDGWFEKPNWIPAHTYCAPTRNVNQCYMRTDPGYWGSVASQEVLIGFQQNADGSYLLNALRADSYGIEGLEVLGENVVCTGSIL